MISTGRDLRREGGLHTLYISPLKALAVDIARNLETPVAEMKLPIRIETRTGDTPASKRQRQRRDPPHILLTTPEQLALILASPDAPYLFGSLRRVVLDELHSLVISKRGDLLSLGLARLFTLAPDAHHRRPVGDGRRARRPAPLSGAASRWRAPALADLVVADGGAPPHVTMLDTAERLPWAGHSARHAHRRNLRPHQAPQDHARLRQHPQPGGSDLPAAVGASTTTTSPSRCITARSTWRSGARSKAPWRRAACARWSAPPRSISASTGATSISSSMSARRRAPRGCCSASAAPTTAWTSRRAACSIPANRFEVLECTAALGAIADNAQDTPPLRTGALDVLAQHVLGSRLRRAVPRRRALRRGARAPRPMPALTRADFDAVVDFVATGGYALKAYERFAKIRQGKDGRWRIAHPHDRAALPHECRHHRRGRHAEGAAGALARLARSIPRGGRLLGEVEEYFIEMLTPGDTFVFAGEILQIRGASSRTRSMSRARTSEDPKVPSYEGGKFPLSTYLADRVRKICRRPRPVARRCRIRCANGWRSRNGARCCPARATCWSRPSRAPTNTTSSAIRSRDGSRTRRSACC